MRSVSSFMSSNSENDVTGSCSICEAIRLEGLQTDALSQANLGGDDSGKVDPLGFSNIYFSL
eukprot:gnl/Chilomastix_caulleri/4329.p1 GENE.gnl/Chilomastix_caulleri/4329~~gnl/Chilomastix_caulleri/4329.p1  ORF type:complete len:62 (-),score=5.96 gnl/Chilomastix_caulleri/4329:87-272(-)